MKDSVGLAMREDALTRRECEHCAAADRRGTRHMFAVGVVKVGLDEGRAGVRRLRVGNERAHFRPSAVRAHEQVGGDHGTIGERERVAAVAERCDRGELLAPFDRAVRQRLDEHIAQPAAANFGAPAGAVVGFVEEDYAVAIEDAGRLTAFVDERAERLKEPPQL